MQVTQKKNTAIIAFDSNNEVTNSNHEREEENDILDKFLQPCEQFQFPIIINEQIEKFKKKVVAFAVQYGTRNEKTTSIFLNFLENTREIATNELKKKDYFTAATFYTVCLGFIDPDDEIFLQKFIFIKIDIINKLMYCLFELEGEKGEIKYIEWGLSFLQNFLYNIREFGFYTNLIKNESCLLQLNYFYLGNLFKKKKSLLKAIDMFLKAQQIIKEKKKHKIYEKNQELQIFVSNLQIKADYIISECYRDEDSQQQCIYESMALKNAQKYNQALYQYLSREIRFYKKGKQFSYKLSRMDDKKKIEEDLLKRIDESKNNEICSLYDVYLDSVPINFSDSLENTHIGSTIKYF